MPAPPCFSMRFDSCFHGAQSHHSDAVWLTVARALQSLFKTGPCAKTSGQAASGAKGNAAPYWVAIASLCRPFLIRLTNLIQSSTLLSEKNGEPTGTSCQAPLTVQNLCRLLHCRCIHRNASSVISSCFSVMLICPKHGTCQQSLNQSNQRAWATTCSVSEPVHQYTD